MRTFGMLLNYPLGQVKTLLLHEVAALGKRILYY
jgi:hypothetical protein